MKVTAFDPNHPYRLGTGTTLGSSAGGDLSGSLPAPTVSGLQGTSVTSNLPANVGDVLTISQVSPPQAIWATPSNTGSAGSNSVTRTQGGQSTVVTHASSGAARQLDFRGGNVFVVTLTANCTFTFTGAPATGEASILLVLQQDGSGNRTVTWPGSVVWASGSAPTLSTAASDLDFIVLESWDAGTTWYGFPVGGSSGTVSPLTTKGDLYTYTTADARLAVGSNGTGIIADSSAPAGIRWTLQALSGELLMADGVTAPPVPIETELQNDWLYADL